MHARKRNAQRRSVTLRSCIVGEPHARQYMLCGVRVLATGASGFIGTHFTEAAIQRCELLNIDIQAPKLESHRTHWRNQDILDRAGLLSAVQDFAPTHVVHLAARTDCDEDTTVEEGYQTNTVGTSNVLDAVRATPSVERLIITSTQYVFNKGAELPNHDEDYHPHTVYGQSKVISEQLTRAADLSCAWTIVRPTNVWGPGHVRQRDAFFYALRKGLYLHPGRASVVRSYGYVRNVVYQMFAILGAPRDTVNRRVFYLGDEPIEQLDWVNAFSRRLKGKPVRVVPESVIGRLGRIGDRISQLTGKPFLITTSRVRSMTEPYVVPMKPTFDVLGPSPVPFEQGVDETARWIAKQPKS
jgi:GlcNAc-P-P-Und epimerase